MVRDLANVGLTLNSAKCQILCDRDPQTRDKLCEKFGFKPVSGTMDILGGQLDGNIETCLHDGDLQTPTQHQHHRERGWKQHRQNKQN